MSDDSTKIEMVDLTPTPDEYRNMARMFANAVVDDARDERRHDTGKLLGSLVEIVAYLGHVQTPAEIKALVETIKRDTDRPQATTTTDDEDERRHRSAIPEGSRYYGLQDDGDTN